MTDDVKRNTTDPLGLPDTGMANPNMFLKLEEVAKESGITIFLAHYPAKYPMPRS
jgi:hypothetical protein